MNLLILYPDLFMSFSKFERKLVNILSEKTPDVISFCSDTNGFIDKYISSHLVSVPKVKVAELDYSQITHAVIFDDGEEFVNELFELKKNGAIVRRLKIKITRVINIKKEVKFKGVKSSEFYEYIGRGAYWGNPYSMYDGGVDRDEVIRKFKYDFDYEKFLNIEKSEVFKLAGKRLGCFCKPEACHGDVLADFLNSWDDGE